jgi:hypothetical protein
VVTRGNATRRRQSHCEARRAEAIPPFDSAQDREPVERLDRHGALRAPRDDRKGNGYGSIKRL